MTTMTGRDAAAPVFEAPAVGPAPSQRILLVSYHFPPSGAVGGLRWQKMAGFAAERGWGVDVLCLDPSQVALRDEARLAELPPGTRLFGVRDERPALDLLALRAWRLLRAVRPRPGAPRTGNGAAPAAPRPAGDTGDGTMARADVYAAPWWRPDPRRRWLASTHLARGAAWSRRATRAGLAIADASHRVVVVSGPPHTAHATGVALARRLALPYVMDLRDPWSLHEHVPESIASRAYFEAAARGERRAVQAAALVSCNTELAARAMRAAHPDAADRIIAVMNGSDEETLPPTPPRERFLIAYAGAVYHSRTPRALFDALGRVVRELGLTPADIGVEFMGIVEGPPGAIAGMARDAGVEAHLALHTPRPRAEALRFLAGAAMLVSLPQAYDSAVPSKIFEYARFDAWLLALASPESATAMVLEGSGADVVQPDDVDAIAATLRARYLAFASGERPTGVGADGRFSRRRQADRLFERIEALVGRPA